jgi:hypothetical protein
MKSVTFAAKGMDPMDTEKLAPDFVDLPLAGRATIEGLSGLGLHHAPAASGQDGTGAPFHHPERGQTVTTWEPNWEPIETYTDGEVVMLDDGDRQLLGRRKMGMWTELKDGEELAQPDFLPMLWSVAPEQIEFDRR